MCGKCGVPAFGALGRGRDRSDCTHFKGELFYGYSLEWGQSARLPLLVLDVLGDPAAFGGVAWERSGIPLEQQ